MKEPPFEKKEGGEKRGETIRIWATEAPVNGKRGGEIRGGNFRTASPI